MRDLEKFKEMLYATDDYGNPTHNKKTLFESLTRKERVGWIKLNGNYMLEYLNPLYSNELITLNRQIEKSKKEYEQWINNEFRVIKEKYPNLHVRVNQ
jgi:hypothetical protein